MANQNLRRIADITALIDAAKAVHDAAQIAMKVDAGLPLVGSTGLTRDHGSTPTRDLILNYLFLMFRFLYALVDVVQPVLSTNRLYILFEISGKIPLIRVNIYQNISHSKAFLLHLSPHPCPSIRMSLEFPARLARRV